jgi:hypothetical protein
MTFRVAGSNLTIAVFHSSNDTFLFNTQVFYCMNIVFCGITGTFISQVFKNTLDEMPNCSLNTPLITHCLNISLFNIHLFIVNLILKMNWIYAFLFFCRVY